MIKNVQVLFYVDEDGDDLMFFREAANVLDFELKLFNSVEKLMLALKDPEANRPQDPKVIWHNQLLLLTSNDRIFQRFMRKFLLKISDNYLIVIYIECYLLWYKVIY